MIDITCNICGGPSSNLLIGYDMPLESGLFTCSLHRASPLYPGTVQIFEIDYESLYNTLVEQGVKVASPPP